jgi:hypothetical protein
MTQGDNDAGKIITLIGIAVLKPAEFIVSQIKRAGKTSV